jgi:hypothetical protein
VIEGRIGTGKRKYGLDRILTKLVETSKSVITMAFFVMNTEKILRLLRLFLSILVSVYFLILGLCSVRRHSALLWAAAWACGPRDSPFAHRKSPQTKFSKPELDESIWKVLSIISSNLYILKRSDLFHGSCFENPEYGRSTAVQLVSGIERR